MRKKLGLYELVTAVKTRIEEHSDIPCYDEHPPDTAAPYYYLQAVRKKQEDTKTMFCELFTVLIHVVAAVGQGETKVYEMIKTVEEALADDLTLPPQVFLIVQTEQGLQSNKVNEAGQQHAVVAFEFKVGYAFKCKL